MFEMKVICLQYAKYRSLASNQQDNNTRILSLTKMESIRLDNIEEHLEVVWPCVSFLSFSSHPFLKIQSH